MVEDVRTVPPAVLPPPPRRVKGWICGSGQMWFGRIFIMPHTLIGIGATGYWLFLWFWACCGTDLKGHVTNMQTSRTSKGRTVYTVKYSYEMAGQTKTASQGVSR